MQRIIMKFGGSSVGDSKRILNVAQIVKSYKEKNPLVVVSAVCGITDKLILLTKSLEKSNKEKLVNEIKKIHLKILKELELNASILDLDLDLLKEIVLEEKYPSKRNSDLITSFGERLSSKIVSATLRNLNVNSKAYNASDIGLITDSNHLNASPKNEAYSLLNNFIKNINGIPVVTGFIGKDENNHITTLGRGGSDYTAAIIGKAISSKEIQIWTDVDGVLTCDPKFVENAQSIKKMTFNEASELAFFGAKVLHPSTILPAIQENIPIIVKNTMNREHRGTKILRKIEEDSSIVTAISIKQNVKIIRICSARMLNAYGFLAKLFCIFEKHKISVDMLASSEVSVSLTIDQNENCKELLEELRQIGNVTTIDNMSIICVVGRNLQKDKSIHGEIFDCVEKENVCIKMISQGPSLINISFVVRKEVGVKTIKLLHKKFFE